LFVDLPTGAHFSIEINILPARSVVDWLFSSAVSSYLDQVRTLDVNIARGKDFTLLNPQNNGRTVSFPVLESLRLVHRSRIGELAPTLEQWLQARAEHKLFLEYLDIPITLPSDLSEDQMEILRRIRAIVEKGGGKVYAPYCFPDGLNSLQSDRGSRWNRSETLHSIPPEAIDDDMSGISIRATHGA
jgi:hypothetical protein